MRALRGGLLMLLVAAGAALAAEPRGRIEGNVTHTSGEALSGVTVLLEGVGRAAVVTDNRGRFAFDKLPVGSYRLIFAVGDAAHAEDAEVRDGETTEVSPVMEGAYGFADTLTVYSASRRRERVVDAPSAISVVTAEQIEREASTGQLPKLLESVTGAEVTQSGLYDFKFNTRGLNISVNRRVAVLIDGRDPSFPFLGAQEWAAVSFPLDDLESAELLRGPSSALYGANAFNGILNLTTKSPRTHPGSRIRLTGGELSTARGEFRLAGRLAEDTYYKLLGSYTESDDFYRSRNQSLEYSTPCTATTTTNCLFLEATPLPLDRDKLGFVTARVDRVLGGGRRELSLEVSDGDIEGYVYSSPGSRFQVLDVDRPWARVNLSSAHWNVLGFYTGRKVEAVTLASATPSFTDTSRAGIEVQGNWELAAGKARLVAGGYAGREKVDTADRNGVQTLIPRPEDDNLRALFGQIDYQLSPELKLVIAARVDESEFYDTQVSPKGSLVWAPHQNHTFRFGYNEGFLRPNYPEYFARVQIGAPADLSGFEAAFCAPVGVACGFARPAPVLAVGNASLKVETIRGIDFGYSAFPGGNSYFTLDVYWTEIEDFVQQFVPQLGTRLGRANPNFPLYAPPAALPEPLSSLLVGTLQSVLGPSFFILSTENGQAVFTPFTAINFGKVETRGLDVSYERPINDEWSFEANYSWFDLDVQDEIPEAPLRANGPEHKGNLGVNYVGERLSGSLRLRWVEEFPWVEGAFLVGAVPSYEVVNLVASYRLDDHWEIGLNVSNLLDNQHYEAFGGDLLERRALGHVSYSW